MVAMLLSSSVNAQILKKAYNKVFKYATVYGTYTQEDEVRARSILMETDLANGDHNMLRGDPSLTNIFDTYNPSSALIR